MLTDGESMVQWSPMVANATKFTQCWRRYLSPQQIFGNPQSKNPTISYNLVHTPVHAQFPSAKIWLTWAKTRLPLVTIRFHG